MFADDLKIFMKIDCLESCSKLQSDLNELYAWCNENQMTLNVAKCNRIVPLQTNYRINNSALPKVDTIKDLGVTFDSKLKLYVHINSIVSKAYRMLGFIMRTTKDFTDINCVKYLYNTSKLVRSQLEYCTSVWTPYQINQNTFIERVKKCYTRQLY